MKTPKSIVEWINRNSRLIDGVLSVHATDETLYQVIQAIGLSETYCIPSEVERVEFWHNGGLILAASTHVVEGARKTPSNRKEFV